MKGVLKQLQKINENLEEELQDGVDHEELPIPNHSYILNLFLSWFSSFKIFFLVIALLFMFFSIFISLKNVHLF
jgi:hypothetical protein